MAAFSRGHLIVLERKTGTSVCAIVEPPLNGWFRAITPEGKAQRFPTSLPAFGPVGDVNVDSPIDDIRRVLADTDRGLRAAARGVDLELLRSCVLADPRVYLLDELAALLFDAGGTPPERGALLLALLGDGTGFDQLDSGFAPVDDATLRERAEARAEAEREEVEKRSRTKIDAAQRRVEQETVGPELRLLAMGRIHEGQLSPPTLEWLRGLRETLVDANPSDDEISYGRDLVRIHDENHAVQLLARAGLWDPDVEDLVALRGELGQPFSAEVRRAAEGAVDDGSPTVDLTHLEAFTIDGPSTSDLDDAISIESVGEALRVSIHIADVARWIPRGSILDVWGQQTGETIYLPETVHHLFPEPLVRRLSLDPGVERAVFTLSFLVMPTGAVSDVAFTRSRIRSRERLDYEEVDRRFANDPVWKKRLPLIDVLQKRREARGARISLLPDVEITCTNGRVVAQVVITDTPAHRFVSELMIFYNEQLGQRFHALNVPAIFKTQSDDAPQVEFPDADDPLYFPRIVRLLRPSISGLHGARHAFMGVDVYCQGTSPIRRYADLVHQRQLAATMVGAEPTYTRDDLALVYPLLDNRAAEVRQLERRRRRYWLLRHLDGLRRDRLKAIVSQIRPGGRPVVFFPDFLLEVALLMPPDLVLEIGDELFVTPKKVDPIRGGVWAKPAA